MKITKKKVRAVKVTKRLEEDDAPVGRVKISKRPPLNLDSPTEPKGRMVCKVKDCLKTRLEHKVSQGKWVVEEFCEPHARDAERTHLLDTGLDKVDDYKPSEKSRGISVARFITDNLAKTNPNVAIVKARLYSLDRETLADRLAWIYCNILGLTGTERM